MARKGTVITASINEVLPMCTGHSTVRTRTNLSILHLHSACLFSRQVQELEEQNAGKEFGTFSWEDIFARASASVLLTVAALESYVNELYADRETNFPRVGTDLLIKLWETYEAKPVLEKVDLALLLREAGPLKRGVRPTQEIALLVRLRNALIHFKPEWFGERRAHAELSDQLAKCFAPSAFFSKGERMFPRRWASHDCTAWAIGAAIEFIEALEKQAGLRARLAQFKGKLSY